MRTHWKKHLTLPRVYRTHIFVSNTSKTRKSSGHISDKCVSDHILLGTYKKVGMQYQRVSARSKSLWMLRSSILIQLLYYFHIFFLLIIAWQKYYSIIFVILRYIFLLYILLVHYITSTCLEKCQFCVCAPRLYFEQHCPLEKGTMQCVLVQYLFQAVTIIIYKPRLISKS